MADDTSIDYQHFFQKLLEAAPWPVLVIDRSLTIRYYNFQVAHSFGMTEPLHGIKLDQLIQDPSIIELVQESILSGRQRSGEFPRENSATTWRISITPLEHKPPEESSNQYPSSKQVYRYFAVSIEDLTELRRLERVRRDFIANVSHELRTPLASVRLLTETLEEAIDTDREQAQIFVEKIEREVQYLTDLVSELLELSRLESGQVPLAIEPVEAEQLVREVMARMLPQAQRHRVTLRTEIQQGKIRVAADSKQIARVLVNLVHNAIKFTPSGGLVVIGTRLEPAGDVQAFFVRDSGIGIPSEDLPRIFERFYKVNRARSKVNFIGPGGAGTGLGLAIARHVVEAHHGHISAESVVGEGSNFTFTLPVAVQNQT